MPEVARNAALYSGRASIYFSKLLTLLLLFERDPDLFLTFSLRLFDFLLDDLRFGLGDFSVLV